MNSAKVVIDVEKVAKRTFRQSVKQLVPGHRELQNACFTTSTLGRDAEGAHRYEFNLNAQFQGGPIRLRARVRVSPDLTGEVEDITFPRMN